ncbi:hypothetical protein XENOCAPTIV_012224 [Xenoophorus captivus]|uniref:Uncharacterized protein n=1 Tax=Xenoophorus captivus TaxID=1517983 RepID=A0ABV0QHV1_9TELE
MMSAIALGVVGLALLISVCLNIFFCMRHRDTLCKEPHMCCHTHRLEEETLSQIEGQYFYDVSHQEQQENPRNHHEQQENPIYGNISTERRGSSEDCYEMMSKHRTRNCLKMHCHEKADCYLPNQSSLCSEEPHGDRRPFISLVSSPVAFC